MLGVRIDILPIKESEKRDKLPVKGTLQFKIVNQGEEKVTVADFMEVESGSDECFSNVQDRIYCDDLNIRFSSAAATEKILLIRWFPVDDCCPKQ